MSYILDALKKSEREHRKRSLPELRDNDVLGTERHKRSHSLQYAILAVLLLNACLLLWWLKPWASAPSKDTARTQSAPPVQDSRKPAQTAGAGERHQVAAGTRQSGPPAQVPSDRKPAGADPASMVATNDASPQQKVSPPPHGKNRAPRGEETRTAPGPKPEQAEPKPAKPPAPPADREQARPEPPKSDPTKAERAKPPARPPAPADPMKSAAASERQSLHPASSKDLAADLKSLTGIQGDKSPARQTLRFHELPAHVRDAMPRIAVSMLLYSGKSDDRRITINGSRMREGQEVSPGLKLEEITPDGAVFTYKGQRFYKGVIGD
ncbi:MAG: general secretion pathway protein GspB [Desulfobacteraceae bacterium]|nr:general secretion pathway protein GspB [Desulfobacteraceae bacterium]